ncbi:hypothetical protein L1857_08540 [Amycolatopsis thermalba]|uniref:Uncharacterized protein n=1 Tax=Amycolatopsis thermalba TaxID=944492 RepID=A0ABY4NS11_9PSEU|nr:MULTISPECIES: hypothetical protein [Amycolatopsis]UQS22861.1 hypothetical protein L1857_08540 [Amycolatopsis thermalba]
MEDPRVDWLVEVFKGMRSDDGLTTDKLRKQLDLIKLLVDDGTVEEAKAELERIVLAMGDGKVARAIRNSLAISNGCDGIEARSRPEERRRWATGADDLTRPRNELLIPKSVSSHVNYEKDGFKELARLILDRAAVRAETKADGDAFQEAVNQPLETGSDRSKPASITLTARDDLELLDHLSAPAVRDTPPKEHEGTGPDEQVTFPQAFNVFRRALSRKPLFPRFAHTIDSPKEEWWTGIVVGVLIAFLIGALILGLTGVL